MKLSSTRKTLISLFSMCDKFQNVLTLSPIQKVLLKMNIQYV